MVFETFFYKHSTEQDSRVRLEINQWRGEELFETLFCSYYIDLFFSL